MFEPQNISGTSNLLNGIMGDTPATDNILGLEPVQNWNLGSGGPTLDVSTLNPGALTNLEGTLIQEETVQITPTTETTDDIDPVTRESSTPVELTLEAGDRLFDAEYYAQINPDLSAAGLNTLPQLFQHFKTHGLGEGRGFSLWTNLEHYAAQNPDLEAAGLTLPEQIYQHLQTFGLAEGREFSPWVDLQYYLDNNADLKAAFGEDTAEAFEHLQIFGLEEGRRFSPKLGLNYYLSHYSDLSAAFGDNKKQAFSHLQQFGVAEGRQFLPEISEATTTESTEVENSGIAEETQEGISIVFETQTTPTTSIPTASDVEEETNTSADLETLPDESETAASVSIEVEEETIPDTSDEVEEETIPDTSDEVEEDEGNATASDDEVEAEQLSPTVTVSQTLMGLEEEPTPPLDLPENAGGANAKKNPAPKHLKLDATQEEYYKGGTVRLNGWIFDPSGANDVERVEFSLHKTGEQWEEIENWTTFNISTKDDRWAYFDYSTFGLEPGKYQIKGFAYDSEGGKSNAAVAHFSVSAENPLPLMGVIDTGFNAKNPDIDYKRAALGTDFVDGDDNPLLEEGEGSEHGTHTLGIIGATQKNGVGIYGINDQAPLWLSRAIGSGKWADALIEFVDYAIASEQPTAIANLSLDLTQVESDGSIKTRYEFTPKEREALEYARQNGILVVVAAGNDGSVMSVLGQASQEFDNIITVGATNGNQRADYSSYGRRGPDIMAEGGSIASPILSTAGEDVGTMAGTSIAAAQVTGVASLVWEANPELNYRQIIEALKSTATDLNLPGEDSETGAGLVNPDAAVEKAKQMTPEDYDPEPFLTPDTWGGEGLVTPEERSVANEEIYLSNFSAEVISLNGIGTFAEPTTILAQPVGSVSYGDVLEFDAWILKDGTPLRYQGGEYNKEDARWYRLAGKQQWIPAVYLEGEPGDSTLLEETPEDDPSTGEGSSTVDEPPITDEPSPTENSLEWELYTVQEGDTLSEIALSRTGNANDYQLIANYPENDISDPNLIYPGQQIWVPKGGSSSSGDSPSPVYAPTFEIYDLFKGAYDEYPEIGAPIGDPQIASSGFVSQEFENAYLEYNGSGIVYIYEKDAETMFAPAPDNEPVLSGKGNLIRTGGSDIRTVGWDIGVQDTYNNTSPEYIKYTGPVWTDIYFEEANKGKNHLVTINWGSWMWQEVITPDETGVIRLEYTKRNQDAYPITITVSAMPDDPDGAVDITSKTFIEQGYYISGKGDLPGGIIKDYVDANDGWDNKDSLVPSVMTSYHPELKQYGEEWWDDQSGDGYYFDPAHSEYKDDTEDEKTIKEIYRHLSTAIFGDEKYMNAGYAKDQDYVNYVEANPHLGLGDNKYHSGIDLRANPNVDLVVPSVPGVIAHASNQNEYGIGYAIAVDEIHPISGNLTGRRWWYLHLANNNDWKNGDEVDLNLNLNPDFGFVFNDGSNSHLHLTVTSIYNDPGPFNGTSEENVLNSTMSPIYAFWKAQNGINEPGY